MSQDGRSSISAGFDPAKSSTQRASSITQLRVVVVSAGDVEREKALIELIFGELNRTSAADRRLRLEMVTWSKDAYPAMHELGPQGVCDEALRIKDSDLVVAIVSARVGTGTATEVTNAVTTWIARKRPQVMVFFNSTAPKDMSPAARHEWMVAGEFQERFRDQGLTWEYKGTSRFQAEFRRCMENYLRQFPVVGSPYSAVELVLRFDVPSKMVPKILEVFSEYVRKCGAESLDAWGTTKLTERDEEQGDESDV